MEQNDTAASQLIELVRLYQKCLDLTEEVLSWDDLTREDHLDKQIRQRAKCLAMARSIEVRLECESIDGRKQLIGVPEAEEARVRQHLVDLKSAMTRLLEADGNLRSKIEDELGRIKDDINRLRKGQSALRAYAPYRGGIAYLIDRRG